MLISLFSVQETELSCDYTVFVCGACDSRIFILYIAVCSFTIVDDMYTMPWQHLLHCIVVYKTTFPHMHPYKCWVASLAIKMTACSPARQ